MTLLSLIQPRLNHSIQVNMFYLTETIVNTRGNVKIEEDIPK